MDWREERTAFSGHISMNDVLLVLQHVPFEHAGRFADVAQSNGIEIEVLKLWENYRIPNLKKYTRLLIMGGPQSVYEPVDRYPSLNFETETIKAFARMHKPVLGVCLGCQLIAHAFGGEAYQNKVCDRPFKETGFYKVSLTPQGESSPLFKGFPVSFEVFQWHGDIFNLPNEAVLLATSQNVQNQAFSCGDTTFALLFHIEVTPQMVQELVKTDSEWLHRDNDVDERIIIEQAYKNEQNLKKLSEIMFNNWLKIPV